MGKVLMIPVSKDILGRIFNGREAHRRWSCDNSEKHLDINGYPINPTQRTIRQSYTNWDIRHRWHESC